MNTSQHIKGGWHHGVVCVNDGDVLAYPGLTLQEFQRTCYWQQAEVSDSFAGGKWCVFNPIHVHGHECAVSLEFEVDILDRLSIVFTDEEASKLGFVTGFSSPADGPEDEFMKKWIFREVGRYPPIQFSWGVIGDVNNSIGGFARIIFVYRPLVP